MTATADCSGWLHDFAEIMSLQEGSDTNGGRICVTTQINGKTLKKYDSWEGFEGRHGQFAWQPETGEIQVGIPGAAKEDWILRLATFKALLIAIASMLPAGTIFIHAATLIKDGEAILTMASSGGGKSTVANRVVPPWQAPGDEWCLLSPDGRGAYHVHILPTWSKLGVDGASVLGWDTQRSYPLRAICVLKQDKVDELERFGPAGAAICLSGAARQAVWYTLLAIDDDFRTWFLKRSFDAACVLANKMPVFLLRASLNGRFWEVLERELW